MTTKLKEPDTPKVTERKIRRCLSCGRSFESEWAGERICRNCKSTETWRRG